MSISVIYEDMDSKKMEKEMETFTDRESREKTREEKRRWWGRRCLRRWIVCLHVGQCPMNERQGSNTGIFLLRNAAVWAHTR